MKGVFRSGVGIEVSARARELCGIGTKYLSSPARGDINYRCVGAVNIGNSEIANLQEVVAEPHAVRRHLAFKGIQLAKTAACAGADLDYSVCSPNICRRKGVSTLKTCGKDGAPSRGITCGMNTRFTAAGRLEGYAEMPVVGGANADVTAELNP
jgi:hypothetical protein